MKRSYFGYLCFRETGGHRVWPEDIRRAGFEPLAIGDLSIPAFVQPDVEHITFDLQSKTSCAVQILEQLKRRKIKLEGVVFSGEYFAGLWADLMEHHGCSAKWVQGFVNISNKFQMRKKLREAGVVKSAPLASVTAEGIQFLDRLDYPCIIKPFVGGGALLTKKLQYAHELSAFLNSVDWQKDFYPRFSARSGADGFTVEPFIEGVELAVDGYYFESEIQIGSVHEYGGAEDYSQFKKTTNIAPDLKSFLKRVFETFHFKEGVIFHAELKHDTKKNDFEVIEINPCPGGGPDGFKNLTCVSADDLWIELARFDRKPDLQLPPLLWNGT